MGIFDDWGKEKVSDSDVDSTKQEANDSCNDYEQRRAAFKESLKVDPSELKKSETERGTDNPDNSDDDLDDLDNAMEKERDRSDDDNIR